MLTYAVIENNNVINVCVASADDTKPDNWVLCDRVGIGIGWDYVDGDFVDNRPEPTPIVPAPAVTKDQLLVQLQELTMKINALV